MSVINNGKKARVFNAVDLIKEQVEGNAGKIIQQLSVLNYVIIDEPGYIPFPKSSGALLFHLISKFYGQISAIITTNLEFGEWAGLRRCKDDNRDCGSCHCAIVETGNTPYRFARNEHRTKIAAP